MRADLRKVHEGQAEKPHKKLDPEGTVNGVAVGVMSNEKMPAVFELVDFRFETSPTED